jgi:hypothetical protein
MVSKSHKRTVLLSPPFYLIPQGKANQLHQLRDEPEIKVLLNTTVKKDLLVQGPGLGLPATV